MAQYNDLLQKANSLPKQPGCYLMKNSRDEIIYVGKAKNLKARVKTYFDQSKKFIKTEHLVKNTKDFEFIITNTEMESLILENNLIKEHSPKYNIRLKDDKTYPYVEINQNEEFPRLEYTRKPKRKKGHKVYGPFPEGTHLKNIIRILTKVLNLRDCSLSEFKSRKTPCLLYQMNQCSAPCVDKISKSNYDELIDESIRFFKGPKGQNQLIKKLQSSMESLSETEEFEKAIIIRDSLEEIYNYQKHYSSQKVELDIPGKDLDIIAYYYGEQEIDLSIYSIRNSLLIGHKNLNFINTYEDLIDFEEDLPAILFQYYKESTNLPSVIILNSAKGHKLIEDVFQSEFKKALKVKKQDRKLNKLIEATKDHARNSQRMREENKIAVFKGLQHLKDLLKLKELPRKLECYDVAIWQGSSPTASQIVFVDGRADKNLYRQYNLTTLPEGNNDFAMMKEVLERRIKKGSFPDVFIVDGGIQQVNVFLKVLKEFEIDIPVVGIAKSKISMQSRFKDKEITRTEERLIIPQRKNPFILKKSPELFRIIVKMRDESHRFSRRLHHKKEHQKLIRSDLTRIEGVGEVTAKKILTKLEGPLSELSKLTAKEIGVLFGIKESIAQNILNYLKD